MKHILTTLLLAITIVTCKTPPVIDSCYFNAEKTIRIYWYTDTSNSKEIVQYSEVVDNNYRSNLLKVISADELKNGYDYENITAAFFNPSHFTLNKMISRLPARTSYCFN